MSGPVAFPQPEVIAPAYQDYFFYAFRGKVFSNSWGVCDKPGGTDNELEALARGEIYLSQLEVEQRIAHDAQEMARKVIPAWFRALGPDVECAPGNGRWERVLTHCVADWSKEHPSRFRAKPTAAPDVVHVLDGVEYRWPATVKQSDPCGDRYTAMAEAGVVKECNTGRYGLRTHHTRAGADAQNAMLTAALGAGS